MYRARLWSVRHARGLDRFYGVFERLLVRLAPLFAAIGYRRLERPFAAVERGVKGLLFDCKMCGQCVLELHRHVLPDELPEEAAQRPLRRGARRMATARSMPEMRCVWVLAFAGAERIPGGVDRDPRDPGAGRPAPRGALLVAARGARAHRDRRRARVHA